MIRDFPLISLILWSLSGVKKAGKDSLLWCRNTVSINVNNKCKKRSKLINDLLPQDNKNAC